MKREELSELGLTDEQVEAVMVSHKKEVNAFREKAEKFDEAATELSGLKEQLTSRDTDIKKLTKDLGDNEELKKTVSELQDKYKGDTEKLQSQLAQTKLDSAITNALAGTKARDSSVIRALLKSDEIKLSESGELVGLNEQVAELQTSKPYLFDGGTQIGYAPKDGAARGHISDLATAMKQPGFNMTEWAKANNEKQ